MAAPQEILRTTGLKAEKGIELLLTSTPNSHKVIIILEELKAVYPELQVTIQGIDIFSRVQFEPWFKALNPNGKGPVLIDHDNGDFVLPESQAIASYLLQKYDTDNILGFEDYKESMTAFRWSAWGNSELAPAATNSIAFYRRYPGQVVPTKKFIEEVERCLGILDAALDGRDYIVGTGPGKLSIADIFSFPFIYSAAVFGLGTELSAYPNVVAWLTRISARPALAKVFVTPWAWTWDFPSYEKKLQEDAKFAEQEEKLQKILAQVRSSERS